MSKARDLANLIASGSILADGTLASTEIDGVTASSAELNILDGVTSTTAELNILDGVTSSAAELSILDGVTSTAAELNILDGVTSTAAELNILDGVTSTAAELNILDGVTANATEINNLDALSRGSILYGNSSGATAILTKGSNEQVLTSDGTDIAWADAAGGGGLTLVSDKVFGGTSGPTAVGNTSVVIGAGTGAYLTNSAHSITVLGGDSLNVSSTTAPERLIVIGSDAGRKLGSGNHNSIYIGHEAVQDGGTATTGVNNVGIGNQVFKAISDGGYNTAVGGDCAVDVTGGSHNTFIGYSGSALSGYSSTSNGSNNVTIGSSTANNWHGSGNIQIGKSNALQNLTSTNRISIGTSLAGYNADRTVSLGDNTGQIYASYASSASWTQTSDERLKKNIADDSLGLSFINELRTVTYKWKPLAELDDSLIRKDPVTGESVQGEKDTEQTFHGLLAQEVKTAMDNAGCTTFDGWTEEADSGIQGVSREQFVIPLIKAVQELSAEIVSLKSRISDLED